MKITCLLLSFFAGLTLHGQFIKNKAIGAQIGFASSAPYYSRDEIIATGFSLQSELILKHTSWLELRPYAGFFSTEESDTDVNDRPTDERVSATAFVLGGKIRLIAPIPYVSPYFELGLGASVGNFQKFYLF